MWLFSRISLLPSVFQLPSLVSRLTSAVVKPPIAFGLISLGVLAFACAPRGRGNQADARAARAQQAAPPRIESALSINARDVAKGIRFDFRVTNAGGGKVEMHFPSGQTHDVVVLDTTGREVWRWSSGRIFTQLMQNRILRSADTIAFDERWKDPPRGQYVAVARLESANYPMEQRTAFVVP